MLVKHSLTEIRPTVNKLGAGLASRAPAIVRSVLHFFNSQDFLAEPAWQVLWFNPPPRRLKRQQRACGCFSARSQSHLLESPCCGVLIGPHTGPVLVRLPRIAPFHPERRTAPLGALCSALLFHLPCMTLVLVVVVVVMMVKIRLPHHLSETAFQDDFSHTK